MSLYVETTGRGPALVLIHGWGLHGGVFGSFADHLSRRFRVYRVDLPGHGHSAFAPGLAGVRDWAGAVAAVVPAGAFWVGWSLGGLIAQQHALDRPANAAGLVLLSSTPRFLAAEGWPGMAPGTLETFAGGLAGDYLGTLRRFLALQVQGISGHGALLRPLRDRLLALPPQAAALSQGLAMLRDTDLRQRLPGLRPPSLWLYGQRDRIVPVATADAVQALLPEATLRPMADTGHAPFLSHGGALADEIAEWIDERRS